MADFRRASCKRCGKHRNEAGPLSWLGYCGTCGPTVRDAANDEMHAHQGPTFDKWRRGMAASVGAVLLDDAKDSA